MNDLIRQYFSGVTKRYNAGNSTEHTFRGDLQNLLEELVPNILATNEPSRIACGAPDYIIQRKDIPLGYIEAKDIGVDLNKTEKSDQLKRYKASLDNLILTDYLEFRFYRYGEKVNEIKIAEVQNGKIKLFSNNYEHFVTLITDFCSFKGQTIKSASKLAKMMAQKARMMEEVICKAVGENEENNTLHDQLLAFRNILIHDLDEEKFADIYAQTIAYGLFAARLNDNTLDDFSREEALFLVPKSNPFLRQLFTYVAGPDLDDRVVWIVNDLADIFQAIDLKELLNDFGKSTQQNDPFIHFYETFLAEYNPKLRKSRGVYYTPEPVVNFIVRAVDDILKEEFNLPQGLADTSKVKIKVGEGKNKSVHEVHKVQILDPATGTGTFLAEVIKQIYNKFEGQKGIWNNYVKDHLIPRVNGFEILMASYSIAHLKLEMLLKETGYVHKSNDRFRIFLTNSLEEAHPDTGTLFASWLSNEASEANYIKRDTPVMVILGNPPYSVSSTNKSEWIEDLMNDYKIGLGEKNIQPLSDDYLKFIRFGEHFIENNGEGILAYISNNSFIDGIIHRQMRKHLLDNFDKVYILDLHGNSKKKEIAPDGTKDENVFDIQQGVSINLFVKNHSKKKNELAKVSHAEIYKSRAIKYETLSNSKLGNLNWNNILPIPPNYLLNLDSNEKGNTYFINNFSIKELFILGANGVKTERDSLTIQFDETVLNKIEKDIIELSHEDFRGKYNLKKDGRDWKLKTAAKDIKENLGAITKILYRPFDFRKTIYSGKVKGFHSYPRHKIHKHIIDKENLLFVVGRQGQAVGPMAWDLIFVSKQLLDSNLFYRGGNMAFPLYVYQDDALKIDRQLNFRGEIVEKFVKCISCKFTQVKENTKNTFCPIDVVDYIYAILHNPTYREKYNDSLKSDFPRIPYPKDNETFWEFVKLGGKLRQIHSLESPVLNNFITAYPENGKNIVTKLKYEDNKVWINEEQFFDNVSRTAWEFYIGGFQPAQKWLKDRKKRELNFEDIQHYQKIIVALTETNRIMNEIDKIEFE